VVCLSVIVKSRKMRRPRPPRGCRAIGGEKIKIKHVTNLMSAYAYLVLRKLFFGCLLEYLCFRLLCEEDCCLCYVQFCSSRNVPVPRQTSSLEHHPISAVRYSCPQLPSSSIRNLSKWNPVIVTGFHLSRNIPAGSLSNSKA
jgi:hypothetical protein